MYINFDNDLAAWFIACCACNAARPWTLEWRALREKQKILFQRLSPNQRDGIYNRILKDSSFPPKG